MPPCTGSRVNTNHERSASCQWRTGDPIILGTPLAIHCCRQRHNHSAMIHPSKRSGTSWAVSQVGHNSESILGRNDSQMSCLNLTLACKYYFVWRRHDNMPPCTDSRVNTNYERIASWGGCKWRTGVPRILETPFAAHCLHENINRCRGSWKPICFLCSTDVKDTSQVICTRFALCFVLFCCDQFVSSLQVSNIRRNLVGNEIVDHSYVGAVGAAPTTSLFST